MYRSSLRVLNFHCVQIVLLGSGTGEVTNVTVHMRTFAGANIRPTLGVNLQSACSTTGLRGAATGCVTLTVIEFLSLRHGQFVVTEALVAIFDTSNGKAVIGTAGRTILNRRSATPMTQRTDGAIWHKVTVATLIFPCLTSSLYRLRIGSGRSSAGAGSGG